ncbi:MAG TPA: endonuclease/exonuclease/phosphatase family protein [Thermoanaerobaculia bacterium]|nr:endonuclease/exonuclease/phosphatase family protein [Thermoanaerobaculia bacterium]
MRTTSIRFAAALLALWPTLVGAGVLLEIYEIQGSGMFSPYVGQEVETRDNVVTFVSTDGFFIQTPTSRADASEETSNAIFVYTGSVPSISKGTLVDVSGRVVEFQRAGDAANEALTEIVDPVITPLSSGAPLPAPVTFSPRGDRDQPENAIERFEGMLVSVPAGIATSGADRFGDFYMVTGNDRPFREPGIEPGASNIPPGIPVWDGNPEVFEVAGAKAGDEARTIVAGSAIGAIEGVLTFAFGEFQAWPASPFAIAPIEFPRSVRSRRAGEMTVASQNLLQLTSNAPRIEKFSRLIREILRSPDVLAVSEAQSLAVLQNLAARITADDPSIRYSAHLVPGNDSYHVGFLVRDTFPAASVEQFGRDLTVPGRPDQKLFDRPPLLLRGSYIANGAPFELSILAVHLRSLIDIETSDFARTKRHHGAVELAELIASLPADIRLVVTGDFNAFEFTDGYVDVLAQITGAPSLGALIPVEPVENAKRLTNQTVIATAAGGDRYSYVHGGNAQVLDHSLTTAALDAWVRGVEFGRASADAPDALSGDSSTAIAASDHDAPVLYIITDANGNGVPDDREQCDAGDGAAGRRRLVRLFCR